VALLVFGGGGVLGDFAFALLIGVASGAYSSIFIASPVLTHWKEREPQYRARRHRIEADTGYVPAYAAGAADVEPEPQRARRGGRVTQPEPETVSAAEFEQMKRDLEIERELPTRHTSTLTQRLARNAEAKATPARKPKKSEAAPEERAAHVPAPDVAKNEDDGAHVSAPDVAKNEDDGVHVPAPDVAKNEDLGVHVPAPDVAKNEDDRAHVPAPDIAENEGVAPIPKPKGASKSRSRHRRHGRRR
jgi:hypothetical protein